MSRKWMALGTILLLAVAVLIQQPAGAIQNLPVVPVATSQVTKPEPPAVLRQRPMVRTGKVEASLAEKLKAPNARLQKFDVVVTTQGDPAAVLSRLGVGVQPKRTFKQALSGFAARLTLDQVKLLQGLPQVRTIDEDRVVKIAVDNATKWTGATQVRQSYWLSGDGDGFVGGYSTRDVVIAIVDTGIDPNHYDLRGKVIGWHDVLGTSAKPEDKNGHGTHVAGTAAGAGRVNPRMKGVAPGAALVGVRVMDENGTGTLSDLIAGIMWVIENAERYNIRIMNISLTTEESSDGMDALSEAVNAAASSGILVTVAAGNIGPATYTIGSPAAAEGALTVGALRDPGELGWNLIYFSSRGPTADGRIKPDIVAPGIYIMAPKAGTTNQYASYSGTSMASPVVAGVAALLFQANPFLSADDVKEILFSTAVDWGEPGKDVDYGWGILDARAAVEKVLWPSWRDYDRTEWMHQADVIEDGDELVYEIQVTDSQIPIAATLILPTADEEFYDLDLYLYAADDTELAVAQSVDRQETINLRVPRAGTYYVRVQAYEGGGPFVLDVSYR